MQHTTDGRTYKAETSELLEVKRSIINLTTIQRDAPKLRSYEMAPAAPVNDETFGGGGDLRAPTPRRSNFTEVNEDDEVPRTIDVDEDDN